MPNGVDRMVATFAGAGLAAPPVPAVLRSQMVETQPRCWSSTATTKPLEMYFLHDLVDDHIGQTVDDYIAVSHAGHGSNSYALNYQLAFGPVVVFAQTAWGGVYMDEERQLSEVFDRYTRVSELLDLLAVIDRTALPSGRLIVVESGLRGQFCGWLDEPIRRDRAQQWIAAHPSVDGNAMTAAVALLGAARPDPTHRR